MRNTTPADLAYRGYMIRFNSLNGSCWVEKSGQFIAYAVNRSHAQRQIDTLVDL